MMTTLARVGFPIVKTPLCALAAERVSEGADPVGSCPRKAQRPHRLAVIHARRRLAPGVTTGRKSACAPPNLWVPGSYARYAEQIATVSHRCASWLVL